MDPSPNKCILDAGSSCRPLLLGRSRLYIRGLPRSVRAQPQVIVHRLWSKDAYRSGTDEDLVRSVVSKGPQYATGAFVYMTIRLTYGGKRADERTRSTDLEPLYE